MPVSYPMPLYVLLVGGSRCSFFLSCAPFQDVCDMLRPYPIVICERHGACRNTRNLLSYDILLSINPVLMEPYIIRKFFSVDI